MDQIISQSMPYMMEMLGIILSSVIAWTASKARQKWGLDMQDRHRQALHSALMTGARLAADGGLTKHAAIQIIVDHVRASVPDALAELRPDAQTLGNLARAKLAEAMAELAGRERAELDAAARQALIAAMQNG